MYAEGCCDPCLLELQNHLPKYYGTWSPPDSPNGRRMNSVVQPLLLHQFPKHMCAASHALLSLILLFWLIGNYSHTDFLNRYWGLRNQKQNHFARMTPNELLGYFKGVDMYVVESDENWKGGWFSVNINENNIPYFLTDLYLKLEDVTRRFVKPCIMDVKLGQQSYDPFASHEKREQQIRKYPLMEEIGFLVLGMRVSESCLGEFMWHFLTLNSCIIVFKCYIRPDQKSNSTEKFGEHANWTLCLS